MNVQRAVLAASIKEELDELEHLVQRAVRAWDKAKIEDDDLYLDSVAFNLHGFYSGVERILLRIATEIDSFVPRSATWHVDLLNQAAVEVSGLRPAVISKRVREDLDEYRSFRHVARNVYSQNLKPSRMEPLVKQLPALMLRLQKELTAFADFLASPPKPEDKLR